MRNGAQVVLLDGDEDLEVVGESYYQENLWHLAGAQPGKERVREDIYAVLVAEDDNPYDPDAVAVWINGLKVGHLSRENAQRYRPGLLAQQEDLGRPIALAGVITGGGIRSDGRGSSACSCAMIRRILTCPLICFPCSQSRGCAQAGRMRSRPTLPTTQRVAAGDVARVFEWASPS
jgi:hypothetical protein